MSETRSRLTLAMFADRIGETFKVQVAEDQVVAVKLIEATELPPATTRDDLPIRSDPFSLIFSGDAEHPLEQRMHVVRHESLGDLDMFVVPIGFSDYEVIFN